MTAADAGRRSRWTRLGWLSGAACAACCTLPFGLVAVGAIGATAAALLERVLWVVAGVLAVAAGLWWWSRRRRAGRACGGESGCGCAAHPPVSADAAG